MDKDLVRSQMKVHRRVAPQIGAAVVSGLFGWISKRIPGTAAAYLGMVDEVDIAPLFEDLPGWRWVLPRVEPNRILTLRDSGVARELHPLGMYQPAPVGPEIPVSDVDVFLVPGVAFDGSGGRLGRGKGYYDRLLSQSRADSVAIGITTSARIVDEVPMGDHDQRVGWLASEDGVTECFPSR